MCTGDNLLQMAGKLEPPELWACSVWRTELLCPGSQDSSTTHFHVCTVDIVSVLCSQPCIALHCLAVICIAVHCLVLPSIALHYSALPRTAFHCHALFCIALHHPTLLCIALHCSVSLCIALHCSALPFIAPHHPTSPCLVQHCSVLPSIALHCFALLCLAPCCLHSAGLGVINALRSRCDPMWHARSHCLLNVIGSSEKPISLVSGLLMITDWPARINAVDLDSCTSTQLPTFFLTREYFNQ